MIWLVRHTDDDRIVATYNNEVQAGRLASLSLKLYVDAVPEDRWAMEPNDDVIYRGGGEGSPS